MRTVTHKYPLSNLQGCHQLYTDRAFTVNVCYAGWRVIVTACNNKSSMRFNCCWSCSCSQCHVATTCSKLCVQGFDLCIFLSYRPVLQSHEAKRAHDRRAELSALAALLSKRVHFEAAQGKQQLAAAKKLCSDQCPAESDATAASLFGR